MIQNENISKNIHCVPILSNSDGQMVMKYCNSYIFTFLVYFLKSTIVKPLKRNVVYIQIITSSHAMSK